MHVLGALSVIRQEELEKMSKEQLQRIFLDAEEVAKKNDPKHEAKGGNHPVAMMGASTERTNNNKKKTTVCYE